MAEDDPKQEPKPTQETKPAEGKPIMIPVPKRDEIEDLLSRAARPVPQDKPNKDQGDALDPYGENWSDRT
jgi:hypothetical protein